MSSLLRVLNRECKSLWSCERFDWQPASSPSPLLTSPHLTSPPPPSCLSSNLQLEFTCPSSLSPSPAQAQSLQTAQDQRQTWDRPHDAHHGKAHPHALCFLVVHADKVHMMWDAHIKCRPLCQHTVKHTSNMKLYITRSAGVRSVFTLQ